MQYTSKFYAMTPDEIHTFRESGHHSADTGIRMYQASSHSFSLLAPCPTSQDFFDRRTE